MDKLNNEQIQEIKNICLAEAPKEACGYVHNGKVYKCENISIQPHTFELSEEDSLKIQQLGDVTLWHSHTDGMNFPSKQDMIMQEETDIPWVIFVLGCMKGTYYLKEYFYFGDCVEMPPLYGRTYRFGVTDCASFVLDYYRKLGLPITAYPRSMDEWLAGFYSYEDYFLDLGFKEINYDLRSLKKNDLLLFNVRANFPNHAGVYLGEGLFGHHLQDRVSKKEPLEFWAKYLVKVLRYEG